MPMPFPALAAAAAMMASAPGTFAPLDGIWGGRGVSLETHADGARLQESCSDIAFDPFRPDRKGRFSVNGRLTTYGAGPQRADEPPATSRVKATGKLNGTTLVLTIHDGSIPPRELRLERGVRAKVIRCM